MKRQAGTSETAVLGLAARLEQREDTPTIRCRGKWVYLFSEYIHQFILLKI